MSRPFHFTIFGATGLTGKQIVRHIFELSNNLPDFFPKDFCWAIAGRQQEGLEKVLAEMIAEFPETKLELPTLLIANVTQKGTLDAMAQQTKVLINAVGPFRFMGEYVVRSCVEQGCNYVDVTGKVDRDKERMKSLKKQHRRNRICGTYAAHLP